MKRTSLVVMGALLVACGGGSKDSGTTSVDVEGNVSGTIGGRSFAGVHAIAYAKSADTVEILVSDLPLDCGGSLAGATALDVDVVGISAGAFPVVDAMKVSAKAGQAESDFNAMDDSCGSVVTRTATSGTLKVSTVGDALIDGELELGFPNGDRLSGPFYAKRCASGPRACR